MSRSRVVVSSFASRPPALRSITMFLMPLMAITLIALIVGCVSRAERAAMTQRRPVAPDQVVFYRSAPAKYDKLGIVRVPITPELRWNERGDATAGFAVLKSKAAAMGANGVLFKIPENDYDRQVTAGYRGDWYTVGLVGPPGQSSAVAEAIWAYEQ